MTYRKRAIPQATRRAVARRYGCPEPGQVVAVCAYCLNVGVVCWHALYSGRASGWVQFLDLDLHHVIPESRGGAGSPANIVLACRSCNRSIRDRIRYPPGARFHEWLTALFSEWLSEPLTQTLDLTA